MGPPELLEMRLHWAERIAQHLQEKRHHCRDADECKPVINQTANQRPLYLRIDELLLALTVRHISIDLLLGSRIAERIERATDGTALRRRQRYRQS